MIPRRSILALGPREMADTSDGDTVVLALRREAFSAVQSTVESLTETVSVDIRKPSSEPDGSPRKAGPLMVMGVVEDGTEIGDDELKLQAHTEAQEVVIAKMDAEEEAGAD